MTTKKKPKKKSKKKKQKERKNYECTKIKNRKRKKSSEVIVQLSLLCRSASWPPDFFVFLADPLVCDVSCISRTATRLSPCSGCFTCCGPAAGYTWAQHGTLQLVGQLSAKTGPARRAFGCWPGTKLLALNLEREACKRKARQAGIHQEQSQYFPERLKIALNQSFCGFLSKLFPFMRRWRY